MPTIPLVSREANFSRDSELQADLSEAEEVEAEKSFEVYCKPIEFYNILQRRAEKNPSFLQRSLHYKLQVKNKKKYQYPLGEGAISDGLQTPNLFPLYIVLVRSVSTPNGETLRSSSYRFKRACKLTTFIEGQTSILQQVPVTDSPPVSNDAAVTFFGPKSTDLSVPGQTVLPNDMLDFLDVHVLFIVIFSSSFSPPHTSSFPFTNFRKEGKLLDSQRLLSWRGMHYNRISASWLLDLYAISMTLTKIFRTQWHIFENHLLHTQKKTIDEFLYFIIEDLPVQCGSRLWHKPCL